MLRNAWVQQYHRDEKGVRRREGKALPPVHHRLCSPYDTDTRYGIRRGSGWTSHKMRLAETCEPDTPHVITQMTTTDAGWPTRRWPGMTRAPSVQADTKVSSGGNRSTTAMGPR